MKLPDLNFRRPSRGSGAGLRPPQFLADLYADLRDRRLLPLVALLVVAIIAAPILLSGKGESEPFAVPPVSGEEAASQASFSVVPAAPQLRDYRKRLGYRQARNPFAQPQAEASSAGEGAEEAPISPESSVEASSGSASTGEESGPEVEIPAAPSEPTATRDETKTKTTTNVVVQNNVIGYEVDVKAGFAPNSSDREGLSSYAQLPNEKNPVVVYMGLTPDHKRALFLMTNQVVAYYGAGHCAIEKESCQLLELKPGKSATFAYGLEEKPFKVTLKKIERTVQTHEQGATVTKEESKRGGKKSE